jgi:flagellar hook protein FlgE
MYSAVSGLKTHQTKMDVIGNNIANVNTVAFKSSSVTFQDILYQNTSGASGANATTGVGGVNAKQIGLGVSTGATNISITSAGAAETTGRAFDLRLTDSSTTNFFIVNTGSENVFTRAGSFYVDGSGNLCMTSTGYTVMGWQVDPETGNIVKTTVSALRIMSTENQTSSPEATTNGTLAGVIDKNDTDVLSDAGLIKNLSFYDSLGYSYTARFAIKAVFDDAGEQVPGEFTIELESILDDNGKTMISADTASAADMAKLFGAVEQTTSTYALKTASFSVNNNNLVYNGNEYTYDDTTYKFTYHDAATGDDLEYDLTDVFDGVSTDLLERIKNGYATVDNMDEVLGGTATELKITDNRAIYSLKYSTEDGSFIGVNGSDSVRLKLGDQGLDATDWPSFNLGNFANIDIDFTGTKNSNNGGKSTVTMSAGDTDGTTGKGKKLGAMIGLSVDNNGNIYGTYDNGNTTLLGQIAVAQFSNASGLEKVGDNCYAETLNSGEFDGIGREIQADGSKITSGELEMSNVDLSTEFTSMITTQRGFQANSRVITTSDTLLEELVNLKR